MARIPSMNELLAQGGARGLDRHGRGALREALHQALDRLRERWRHAREGSADPSAVPAPEIGPEFWEEVEARLSVTPALRVRRAVNATGVVLHTGLGRAPWPREAMAAAVAAARSAVLEIDEASGRRGRREAPVAELLRRLTGAQAALAVNNNAAALLLAVAALARGRKVLLSRGEEVEIGGSYRIPEVVTAAGAELVEVGTTNRTRAADYLERLEDPEVACVLKVHRSNFRQIGFVEEAPLEELREGCREHGVPLVYDLGSGVLHGRGLAALEGEPTVTEALRAGADLVTFSGDKLLGGPQAGLIVGAAPLVERLRRDMLTRCLRLDKTILAALEAVLALHALGEEAALRRIPALAMLAAGPGVLEERARRFREALAPELPAGWSLELVSCEGRVGSGASAETPLPGTGLALAAPGLGAEDLARRLRTGRPPVFGRVHGERLLLDLRTVSEDEEAPLRQAVARLFRDAASAGA